MKAGANPYDGLSNAAFENTWAELVREAEYALSRGWDTDEWGMTRMDFRAILWANNNLKPKQERSAQDDGFGREETEKTEDARNAETDGNTNEEGHL